MKKFLLFVFISFLTIGTCNAQLFKRNGSRRIERGLFSKSPGRSKEIKVKEPRSVSKAKKKQERNDRKLKREYAKFVKGSQKRSIKIQTPDVQARMKQNMKDAAKRDRAKKKRVQASTKKAGKKYN